MMQRPGHAARRLMPIMSADMRKGLFENLPHIKDRIVRGSQSDILLVEIAKELIAGDRNPILQKLSNHPFAKAELFTEGKRTPVYYSFFHFLGAVTESITPFRNSVPLSETQKVGFEVVKRNLIENSELKIHAPESFALVLSALALVPDVIQNKVHHSIFSSPIAWLGGEIPSSIKASRIALVLSAGGPKGIFYIGFAKAIQEAGLWPDFIVGSSAGAMAGATFACGKDLADVFSLEKLRPLFHPSTILPSIFSSLGRGVTAHNFGPYLHEVFGDLTFEDAADFFAVSTLQRPVKFGKVVFGRASEHNNHIALSSNLPVWEVVWGSSAMQGIIPQPIVRNGSSMHFERLVNGDGHVSTDSASLPFATLEDGAAVEYLPLLTANLILRKMDRPGLIIAVNLANLNPDLQKISTYVPFSERLQTELLSAQSPQEKMVARFRAVQGWFRQDARYLYEFSAPVRAFGAFEAVAEHNASQVIQSVRGQGLSILINPNAHGELDGVPLLSLNGAEQLIEYGYKVGKELCTILTP